VLGATFVLIVFALPQGVLGLIETQLRRRRVTADEGAGIACPPLLAVEGLSKSFGGLLAVDGVSFEVNEGQIEGIIGPNGSGKTTLLNLLSGALPPASGSIRLSGRPIAGLPAHEIARLGVARTFQLVRILPSMTCGENIATAALFRLNPGTVQDSAEQTRRLLALVGLGASRTHIVAGELTYIDQKRLELARALALEPKVLLLDEWLAGLNHSELEIGIALIARLRQQGMTIVMVEHVMDAIRALCTHCIVMNAGSIIAQGTPDQVLADPKVVAAYLGGGDA
jgi:branched-chain amino acid transport system permease protein